MRSAAEIVEALLRELLPPGGSVGLDDIEQRKLEFDAVALQAGTHSSTRAIARTCSEELQKLCRHARIEAFRL